MDNRTQAEREAAEAAVDEWAKGKSVEQLMAEFRRDMADYAAGRYPRKPAEVVEFPPVLGQAELWRRQQALDIAWQRTLDAKAELERDAAMECHRGPGDPDYPRGRRW
jgi:hypothetical protein